MTEMVTGGMSGFLIGLALKSSLILACAGLASVLLRDASAAARHWIWFLGMSALLALPLAQMAAPRWEVELAAGWAPASPGYGATTAFARPAPLSREKALVGAPQAEAVREAVASDDAAGSVPSWAPLVESSGASIGQTEASRFGGRLLPLLITLWSLGAAVLLGSLVWSMRAVGRLERAAGRFEGGQLEQLFAHMAARMGVRRSVRLLRGKPDAMPMSWGILRPVVLLPEGAGAWQRQRLVSVLLHELAHVRRRDCLTQLLAEVALALHWFNPLAWLAARRLRVEREHACDDLVLATGARASDYAVELLSLAQDFRSLRGSALAAVAMARPVHLGPRLKALFDERRRRTLGLRSSGLTAAAACAALLVLAAFTPTQARGPDDPAAPASPPAQAQTLATAELPDEPRSTGRASLAFLERVLRQVATCGLATEGWRQMSHQSDDDDHRLSWSRPGCDVDVRVDGDVEFSSDFADVARMGRNALLRIEEEDGGTERRLDVTAGADGRPTYQFRVDGRDQAFDEEARVWYQAMLLQVFRRGGFMAEERVAALLRSGGVPAVMQELEVLSSDHVFAAYASALLEQADLDDADAVGLVDRARQRVDSDHYLSSILEAMAARHLDSPAVLDAFIEGSRTIESDHYRAQVLGRALEGRDLAREQVASLLASAGEMESDHYLAEMLRTVGARYVLDPALQASYLRAVESIESDHYRAEVLTALLERSELDEGELITVLRAAGGIASDHYQSEILRRVARGGIGSAEVRRTAIELSTGLESDHYRAETLRQFLESDGLADAELRNLIGAARAMGSDHYKSEILSEIARRHALQGETRELFLDAVDTIESSHYRGEVADVLLRQGRGGD